MRKRTKMLHGAATRTSSLLLLGGIQKITSMITPPDLDFCRSPELSPLASSILQGSRTEKFTAAVRRHLTLSGINGKLAGSLGADGLVATVPSLAKLTAVFPLC